MDSDETVLVMDRMVRAWACQQRGLCCQGHRISVDRVQYDRMLGVLQAAGDPRAAAFHPEQPPDEDGWRGLPTHDDARDACIFLTDDQRCGFRLDHGPARLPHVCQKYPYISLYTPSRLRVGLSFTCPTALGLLADQAELDVLREPDGEPPVPFVTHLAAADRVFTDVDGGPLTPDAFWARHDALADAFAAAGPSWRAGFAAMVAAAGEAPVAPIAMTETSWLHGAFDGHLYAQLGDVQHMPAGLPGLWSQSVYRPMPDPPPFDGDEDALLTRYLAHRLLVPAFYVTRTDLGWLLGALAIAIARYRVERARGAAPVFALRHAELLLIHSPLPTRILGEPDQRAAWRVLAAIALAD